MSEQNIKEKIESDLACKIIRSSPLSGGCISHTERIECSNGEVYVLKSGGITAGAFYKEANGLTELRKAEVIDTPAVILAANDFILIEYIRSSPAAETFFEDFGTKLALLHKHTNEDFGFFEDNFIGATIQKNTATPAERNNWCEFYFNKRLIYQYRLAETKGYADRQLKEAFIKIEKLLPGILEGSGTDTASLLHGDLWSGNYLKNSKGQACLIDPATYYGHREADLAMTSLFGGFPESFYKAYAAEWPLDEGWEYRQNIYKLYHILNHMNLFGKGYYRETLQLLSFYL